MDAISKWLDVPSMTQRSEAPCLPHSVDGADAVADAVGREAMYRRDS